MEGESFVSQTQCSTHYHKQMLPYKPYNVMSLLQQVLQSLMKEIVCYKENLELTSKVLDRA